MTDTPTSAAIYARISADRLGEGLGVARQERLCRDLAERLGWPVTGTFVDNNLSASSGGRRPQFERLLRDLREGVHDGVIVADLDRLTRTPSELEDVIALCDAHGVALANAAGRFDLTTTDGRLNARLLGAVAKSEVERKSDRQVRANEALAAKGALVPRRPTFGWRRDAPMKQEPREAALIRDAVVRVLAGASLRSIALEWNQQGIPTVAGNGWDVTAVRNVLANPRHAGLQQYKGEIVGAGQWEPIITREQHERISAMVARRKRGPGRPRTHLLSGVLRCGKCGAGLAAKTANRLPAYGCPPPPLGCAGIGLKAEPVEELVVEHLLTALERREIPAGPKGDGADLVASLAADEDMLDGLAQDYAARRLGRSEWLAAREVIAERIEATRRALERLDVPEVPADPRAWWARADVEQRRALLGVLIDRIDVAPATVRGRFDPDRFTFVLTS